MRYKIEWLEEKMDGKLYEVSVTDIEGHKVSGTIWKTDKDGKEFPNFANLKPGEQFEANAWTNPTSNKITFYPPKEGGAKGNIAVKSMEKKAEYIREAQDNKDLAIRLSSAMRGGYELAIAENNPTEERILYWRQWILNHWEDKEDLPF